MTIAIPVCQERISPVLDTAARLLLVTRHRGRESGRKEFVLGPLTADALARSISGLGVDVLLCAALSDSLWHALEREHVRVRPHLCGEVKLVLRAYCCGRVNSDEYRMPGCFGMHLRGACCPRRTARIGKYTGNRAATRHSK